VRIRRPDEPSDDNEPTPREGPAPGVGYGPDGSVFFRVRIGVIAGKFVVAVLVAIIALTAGHGVGLWLGLIAAALMAGYGLRDVLGRERLRADANGVRIGTGFAGHRDLPWSRLERVRVDQRLRLGLRTDLLELDAGEELFLLSRYDLGADPHDAYEALSLLRGGDGQL
jgi:Bacterial PH domain